MCIRDSGYAAYVLARAERVRQAAANESRRQNLLRKELAWLRRGPPCLLYTSRSRVGDLAGSARHHPAGMVAKTVTIGR